MSFSFLTIQYKEQIMTYDERYKQLLRRFKNNELTVAQHDAEFDLLASLQRLTQSEIAELVRPLGPCQAAIDLQTVLENLPR
jgi:hypothetical protein